MNPVPNKHMRDFTERQLAEFDGEDGRPTYIAFAGMVYDVSESTLWKKGSHMHRHLAGVELTEQLGSAPHGSEVFDKPGIECVGVLKEDVERKGIKGALGYPFRKFPMLRRHPHPILAQFPNAYLTAAALITALHLLFPSFFGLDCELIAFIMLVLAAVFTLFTMATGFLTWSMNYQRRTSRRIRRKIRLSVMLLAIEVVAIGLRLSGPLEAKGVGIIYYFLMMLMIVLVSIIAYNGGELVFPTSRE